MRKLVREATLAPSQFILPLFVCEGEGVRKEIGSMPGNAQLSVDNLVREAEECKRLGLGGLILFGIPETKDELASQAYADQFQNAPVAPSSPRITETSASWRPSSCPLIAPRQALVLSGTSFPP